MNKCIEYYKDHFAPKPPPQRDLRKTSFLFRFLLAIFDFIRSCLKGEVIFRMTHPMRYPPYVPPTPESNRVYDLYAEDVQKDLDRFHHVQMNDYTVPQCMGCDRWCGRKGVFFCTEDINNCFTHKKKTIAPPHETPLSYEHGEYSAADVLWRVVGPPPADVVHRTGPHAPGSDRDSSSSLLAGDEESGSFLAPEESTANNNSTSSSMGVGQRAAPVNQQQPNYTPKTEVLELAQPDGSSVINLPV